MKAKVSDSVSYLQNFAFFRRLFVIVDHIQRTVTNSLYFLYLFQQMTSKIKSLGACEQFCSIFKCWFNVLSQ